MIPILPLPHIILRHHFFSFLGFSAANLNYISKTQITVKIIIIKVKSVCYLTETEYGTINTGSCTYLLDLFYFSVQKNHNRDLASNRLT